MNKNDAIFECFSCERQAKVKDVAMTVACAIEMMEKNSDNVAAVKAAVPKKAWNGLMNTLMMTLLSAVNAIGMTEEEAYAYARRLAEDGIDVRPAVVTIDDGKLCDKPGSDIPKA